MRTITILVCALLAGCSNSITLPAYTDGYPGTPLTIDQRVLVHIPNNWIEWNFQKWGPLKRTGQLNLVPGPIEAGDEGPIIRVDFGRLAPMAPPTPEGQVASYVDAIHSKEDSTVVLENHKPISHPVYGDVRVWYMHSSCSGHRLLCKYINRDAGLTIELICDSRRELNENEDAFFRMASTFAIKDEANKSRMATALKPHSCNSNENQ